MAASGQEKRKSVVLVAQDDENDFLLLCSALAEVCPQADVRRVRDGEGVINWLTGVGYYRDRETFPLPVVIILDLHMPGMSGLDILKTIRRHPLLEHYPVVVMSRQDIAQDENLSLQLGANDFYGKPKNPEQMRKDAAEICRKWLE